MIKHLVLAGGGHAHLAALLHIDDYVRRGHKVTLVSPVTHLYYSGMGAGMLAGTYTPADVRIHIRKLAEDRGASFVQGEVDRIRAEEKSLILASGEVLSYDIVSFNTGSFVPTGIVGDLEEYVYPVKPVGNLLRAQATLRQQIGEGRPKLVVAGGGPAGVEVAGNLQRLVRESHGEAHITLVTGGSLLPAFPEKARLLVRESFCRRGIEIREKAGVTRIENGALHLDDGSIVDYDMVFPAWGVRPSAIFAPSGLPVGSAGALLVNNCLQSVAHPEIFGGGDCVSLQDTVLDKVGVYAVRQSGVLHRNLLHALEGRRPKAFHPQKSYLLLFNLGDDTGLFVRKSWIWRGRLAWILKDIIDRRFVRKYQVSGEHSGPPPAAT